MVGELGKVGTPLATPAPIGAVAGVPQENGLRLFYLLGGAVRSRVVSAVDGSYQGIEMVHSPAGNVQTILHAQTHPLGYTLVLWASSGELQGRLVAP
jgi:hypothetical protein